MRIPSSAILLLIQAVRVAAIDAEHMQRLVEKEMKKMSGVESPDQVAEEVDAIVRYYERMADEEETIEDEGEEETNDDFNFREISLSVRLDENGDAVEALAMNGDQSNHDPYDEYPKDMPTDSWVHYAKINCWLLIYFAWNALRSFINDSLYFMLN